MSAYNENASIIYTTEVGKRQSIIRIAPDNSLLIDFTPGQYLELALPILDNQEQEESKKLISRPYSITSTPSSYSWYEFYVVLAPQGKLTPSLLSAKIGDRVWIGTKAKGNFTLGVIPKNKNIVAISTGTGIAPFVSMIRHYLESPLWKNFTLVHGARTEKELGYYEELKTYADSSEHFNYIPTVSRSDAKLGKGLFYGRVQKTITEGYYEQATSLPLNTEDSYIMLCGNPDMIVETKKILEERGFKEHKKNHPGNIVIAN